MDVIETHQDYMESIKYTVVRTSKIAFVTALDANDLVTITQEVAYSPL